jgi:pimeloyl-ACP methyl ester carboxylesterase
MADLVKGSSLEIIPNTGHLPTLENPKTTNRILKEWLN